MTTIKSIYKGLSMKKNHICSYCNENKVFDEVSGCWICPFCEAGSDGNIEMSKSVSKQKILKRLRTEKEE